MLPQGRGLLLPLALLLVVVATLVAVTRGQKIEKDGLGDDRYNHDDDKGDENVDQGYANDDGGDDGKGDDQLKRKAYKP